MANDPNSQPTHGWTKFGHAVHATTMDHLPSTTGLQRFNNRVALSITTRVGTMACAYVFTMIALISLPDVLD